MQRCSATVDFFETEKPLFPPTINDEHLHEHVKNVVGDMLGPDKIIDMQPLMGSEDFSFYQEVIPGYFSFIGMQDESSPKLKSPHSPYFMLNEDVLPYGAALHASVATRYLLAAEPKFHPSEGNLHDEL